MQDEFDAKWSRLFETDWKPLLQTGDCWDEQKIRNELHDLVFVSAQVSEVYCYITGGVLSKPFYYAQTIKSFFDQAVSEAESRAEIDLEALCERITALFKPWFVRRRKGQCQVLFALTELDGIVDRILEEVLASAQGNPHGENPSPVSSQCDQAPRKPPW